MSHEIRTPMNGILDFAELLIEPDLIGEEQQNHIRIIEKSGARMLNIITDIVDISKIQSGVMEINFKESKINNPDIDLVLMDLKMSEMDGYESIRQIRRFFQHVLPSGFYKIRYFGFLSLSTSKELVGLIFGLLEKNQFLPRFARYHVHFL